MVTKEQLDKAHQDKEAAEKVIQQYNKERAEEFEQRLKNNPIFTDEELVYSESALCPCGHGLAYPKNCGPFHYWDCSAILKGVANDEVKHTAQLPFTFYAIRAEGENPSSILTTRAVFKPKSCQPK